LLAPICKSNVCFVWPLFPPLKKHHNNSAPFFFISTTRKVKNPWYASHTILSPSDRDLKASDYYFLKCMCSPPEIIHTMNHTTSPNLSSSPEQGTSSFEKKIPLLKKWKYWQHYNRKNLNYYYVLRILNYMYYIYPPTPEVYIPYISVRYRVLRKRI